MERGVFMKRNLKTRIASLALAMVMLLSCIPGTAWAVDNGTDIQAIQKPTGLSIVENYDRYVGENWVSMLDLPATVVVTLPDNSEQELFVSWDTSVLDMTKPGYYAIPGEVTLPEGVTNSRNLTASITVQVREYKNLITNGDFNSGMTGWKSWTLTGMADPKDPDNKVLFAKRSAMVTNAGGNQIIYQRDAATINALVGAFSGEGEGQYYFAIDAMSAPYDASSAARNDLDVWIDLRYNTNGTGTGTSSAGMSPVTRINSTDWTIISTIVDMIDGWNWLRTDAKCKGSTTEPGAVYLDNFQLVPLKQVLKAEPDGVSSVKTDVLSRYVVINYPDYVGDDWKTQLGLPKSVDVLTDNGSTVSLEVTWDYSSVDFTKYGKYTLIGTLDPTFPNPKGITVEQNIYITKAQNMIPNGGFESGLEGWSIRGINPKADRVQNPVQEGKYAAVTGTISATKTPDSLADTRNMVNEIGANVASQGAGQYYYSLWAMSDSETLIEGLELQTWLLYKTKDENGTLSASTIKKADKVAIDNKQYAQSCGILEMPANVGWTRLDMYISGKTYEDLGKGKLYLDNAQLIPLNVIIPKGQEPAEVTEVLTEIPVRAVMQNYDQYLGANWQSALGLPETVQVRTAKGNTASVGVIWDFAPLNLDKTGKYTLVGTLDSSTYPNPQNLYVTQTIYIREYKNLLTNGGFEGTLDGWYIRGMNPGPSVVTNPVFSGKYAAVSGAMVSERTSESVADTRNFEEQLGAAIALQGGGQYYYSAWVQSASSTLIENLNTQAWFLYKTKNDAGELSASTAKKADQAKLSNKKYAQTSGLMELPENVAWGRFDIYISAGSAEDLTKAPVYLDNAELLPLNVIVEQYEGEMVQVETIIPARNIIQNYPDYIGDSYTTADLMLPETLDVRSSTGQIVTVGVKWDYSKLNLSKIGTYKLVGVLEDMKIANPKAITVDQVIHVVSYKNLLENPSFEDYGDNWKVDSNVTSELGIKEPVKNGKLSLLLTVGRLEGFSRNWIQSLYLQDMTSLGLRVTASGGGRYFFSGWAQGTANSTDIKVYTRFWYRYFENGSTSVSKTAPSIQLSAHEYLQSGAIMDLPDDIYWARLDMYLEGSAAALRNSKLYIDHMELIPLNVEVPGLNDVIDCESVPNVYAHQGSSFENLKLPEELQIVIKSGQKFKVPVKWNVEAYDANKIGTQTVTGTLDLGTRFRNLKNFVPSAVITLRAPGEELRQTIYIANDGDEANDGLSPSRPKKEITPIATYLAQGYNVKLKRGDIWYIPTGSLTFKELYGTEDAPLVIGSYGSSSQAKPTIGFMRKIENYEWELIDERRNVYAVDVSSFGQKQGESVHRCFVDDEAYFHLSRSNYVSLEVKEFCSYNNTLYIRMPEGEAPHNVEITPFGSGAIRINIQDISYVTFEQIHIKGASSIFPVIRMDAPTNHVKFTHMDLTHVWYYTFLLEADDERVHNMPEFSYLYIDTMLSVKQGAVSGYDSQYWNPHGNEGITMRDGVDGAWIHHNHIRNVSHAFVAIESLDKDAEAKTTGVYNCVIEDNVMEGGNALYARPFNICGGYNMSGVQMCRDNTYRRNKCYDMTVSSHLYGENNLIYSNLISYSHSTYNEDGTLFDGKSAQPWGFDTMPWNDHGSVGNVVVNNTFYDVAGAVASYDQAETVYNNLYANNLVVNWKSDTRSTHAASGAFYDNTIGFNYYMNNAVYSHQNYTDHFVVDGMMYSAENVNNSMAGYSGNLYGDPKFLTADLTLLGKGVRQDFTLSGESPFRYAGISLYNPVYEGFPAWDRLKAEYTDINGIVYLAESPSIGAWSFCERIKGDVASVGTLPEVLCRPGATIDQLLLPDSVPAVNDQGIDVILLVTWDTAAFDSSKPGTVTLTGELRNGPHTELDINGKVATVTINIKDKLELMNIVTSVQTLTVLYGTSLEDTIAQLPGALHVVEETGFEEELPVTWECMDYKPNVPGDYIFKCVLPENMITNTRDFNLEVSVRVMHELGRGVELLINPDFVDGTSAGPWKIGWCTGATGSFRVTEDPQYLPEGERGAAIVTVERRYASIQQDVTGQVKLMGDGQYLFRVMMRAYDPAQPIDTSYPCVQVLSGRSYVDRCRAQTYIGEEYVEYYKIMNLTDVEEAQEIMFHTSTWKSREDAEEGPRSYVIAGCSFVYLGDTTAEVNATLDSMDLIWNNVRGKNSLDMDNVMSDLNLPTSVGAGSQVTWTSSDESAITNDGKVIMGRLPKEVILTSTATYKGIETVRKFTLTVPRDPALPVFTGSLSGEQTVNVGDQFQVKIAATADKTASYNAARFILSFNARTVELVGVSEGYEYSVDGGGLVITRIGSEFSIDDTVTVTFRALKAGMTDVKLVSLEMDHASDVTLDTLPVMNVVDGSVTINVLAVENPADDGAVSETEGEANDDLILWIVVGAAALVLAAAVVVLVVVGKKKRASAQNKKSEE